ncbi:hypothetical protein [Gorillibacterium sp. sgz5001074]|uniref:hypothetical protein n=1 Tax=Gorillibacterium sp. sgz5001074 TaxID=3446695 RepID=UPI003F66C673
MLALANWYQEELFPRATAAEIEAAKSILRKYKRMRGVIDSYSEREAELSSKELDAYQKFKHLVERIEQAVALIQDQDSKRMIERRFINGVRWKDTVLYFRSCYSESTVDRRINKGIESVAETLKLWA